MSLESIVEKLYLEDGLRNRDFLNSLLDEDFKLEWDSSVGSKIMTKSEILEMADELKANYEVSKVSILDVVHNDSKLVVHYLHHVSTIENPKELITIAKVVVIWEFQNDKILNGYQISKAG